MRQIFSVDRVISLIADLIRASRLVSQISEADRIRTEPILIQSQTNFSPPFEFDHGRWRPSMETTIWMKWNEL